MSESDKQQNKELGFLAVIASAISNLGDSAFGYFLGFGLFMGLFMAASKWDGHLFDRKGCIQIQSIEGVTYKVDSCSGDITPVNKKTLANATERKK